MSELVMATTYIKWHLVWVRGKCKGGVLSWLLWRKTTHHRLITLSFLLSPSLSFTQGNLQCEHRLICQGSLGRKWWAGKLNFGSTVMLRQGPPACNRSYNLFTFPISITNGPTRWLCFLLFIFRVVSSPPSPPPPLMMAHHIGNWSDIRC